MSNSVKTQGIKEKCNPCLVENLLKKSKKIKFGTFVYESQLIGSKKWFYGNINTSSLSEFCKLLFGDSVLLYHITGRQVILYKKAAIAKLNNKAARMHIHQRSTSKPFVIVNGARWEALFMSVRLLPARRVVNTTTINFKCSLNGQKFIIICYRYRNRNQIIIKAFPENSGLVTYII